MKRINLGIIGLGFIGKVHLKNCLNLKSARVVAVADTSKKALRFAKENGVKRLFTDYNELLKQPNIDAVIISVPTYLHSPCAICAAEEGKHIFLEKPLARNPNEGMKIISAVRKHDVKLMVGYPLRYSKEFVNLKKKLEKGELGDIQLAHAVNIGAGPFLHRSELPEPKPVPHWWLDKELVGGGALLDLGSHMINLTRWYFGEVKGIKAYLGYRFNFDLEDYAICITKFESGTVATIEVGWFSQRNAIGIEIFGTVAHAYAYIKPSKKIVTAIQLLLKKTSSYYTPHLKEIVHFINCIENDCTPLTSGDDALKDLEAILWAYKS
jgi:predicted dehydrogenase